MISEELPLKITPLNFALFENCSVAGFPSWKSYVFTVLRKIPFSLWSSVCAATALLMLWPAIWQPTSIIGEQQSKAWERSLARDGSPQRLAQLRLIQGWTDIRVSISARAGSPPRFVLAAKRVEANQPDSAPEDYQLPQVITDYLNSQTATQIGKIDKYCGLTAQQQAKLDFAAKGDLNRLLRATRRWCEVHQNLSAHDPRDLRQAMDDMVQINDLVSDCIHEDDSVFQKVLHTILTPEQKQAILQAEMRTYTDDLVAGGPHGLEFSDQQISQVLSLLAVAHARFGKPQILWDSDYYYALLKTLDRDELQDILTEQQLHWFDGVVQRLGMNL